MTDEFASMSSEFVSMTEIGNILGFTPFKIRQLFRELGLRTSKGKPSRKAVHLKLVGPARSGKNPAWGYYFTWHKEKTLEILRKYIRTGKPK